MAYTPFHADWEDHPSVDTPIIGDALEHIEGGIVDAHEANADTQADVDANEAAIEAALALVDAEHTAALAAHLADAVAAHQASAVAFTPGGTIGSTTVQEAILEAVAEFQSSTGITPAVFDEKGQLLSSSAADTLEIVPAPSGDELVLTSDAAEPSGLKWAEAAGGYEAATASVNITGPNVQAPWTYGEVQLLVLSLTPVTAGGTLGGLGAPEAGIGTRVVIYNASANSAVVLNDVADPGNDFQNAIDGHIVLLTGEIAEYVYDGAYWRQLQSPAQSIPISDTAADFTATTVEGALAELQSDAEAHLADTSNAHMAEAIGITDAAGDFTATHVEGALAELQTEDEAIDVRLDALETAGYSPWQIIFNAVNNEPPAASFATFDTRNSHPVLDFDQSADESAVFRGLLPSAYAAGGLSVTVHWVTSATSGNVIWEASIERIGVNVLDIEGDSFATAVTATAAADTNVGDVVATTFLFSNGAAMDSLAAGEQFRLKIMRDANNGSDTIAADVEVLMVVVKEQ